MSEITTLAYQKEHKPKIEEVIPAMLKNNSEKIALDFVAFLRESKINPTWTLHNAWKVMNKGKPICYIRLGCCFWRSKHSDDGRWEVTPYLNHMSEYENAVLDEGLQDLIWDNLCYCKSCGNNCAGSVNKTILGKEIENICGGNIGYRFPVPITNPDDTEIDGIKRLLELEKKARAKGSPK
ncbi:MAG: hypothetical protein FWE06_05230 [Oscillospiraceae bacterium]|nr:hypothetical protein [Oscillospiraceae bacterium]